MATTIMIGVYSGRPNPRFELSDAQEHELDAMIASLTRRTRTRMAAVRKTGFGVIQIIRKSGKRQSRILCGGGIVEFPGLPFSFPDAPGIGRFLLGICPDPILIRPIKQALIDIWKLRDIVRKAKKTQCAVNYSADASSYDLYWGAGYTPDWMVWNRQPCNNCYDYANQQLTDSFSQPGLGGGQKYVSHTCAAITAAAVRDGLAPVNDAHTWLSAGSGWYVALVLGKVVGINGKYEPDFHWFKQDKSGCWSHKLGGGMPMDVDANGNKIKNPATASLNFYGGMLIYDKFCGFFRTNASVIIRGDTPNYCQPAY